MVGKDRVRVFKWTGRNDYVALCEPDYISFGGGCAFSFFFALNGADDRALGTGTTGCGSMTR